MHGSPPTLERVLVTGPDAETLRDLLLKDGPGSPEVIAVADGLPSADAKRPDALLLSLPSSDPGSLEKLRLLHSRFPAAPLMVLASTDDEAFKIDAIRGGAQVVTDRNGLDASASKLLDELRYAVERRRMEDSLIRGDGIYRTAFEDAANCLIVMDRYGRYMKVNRAYEHMTGYTGDDLLGHSFRTLQFPEDVPEAEEILRDIHSGLRGSYSRERRFRRKDGGEIWALVSVLVIHDANGSVRFFLSQAQNITKRKQVEIALRESEERFRLIFENAGDGVLIADVEKRKFVAANSAICKMLGYTYDEILELGVADIHPTENLSEIVAQFQRQVRREIHVVESLPVKRKDGSVFYCDIGSTPMVLDGKSCLVGIFRDITDRKDFERELLDAISREQKRIGADLHDGLGQELTYIALMLKGLEQKVDKRSGFPSRDLSKLTAMVNRAIRSARVLAKGLFPMDLDMGGLSSALEALASRMTELTGVKCRYRPEASVSTPDEPASVHLYWIVHEAITNAIRHGRANEILVTMTSNDDSVTVTVSDDGIGMQEDSEGLGIRGMKFRTLLVGGSIEFKPHSEGGTRVICTCPLKGPSVRN
jgi:PAS domain S-box-containing protein